MHNKWYKKQRARKLAPQLVRWVAVMPIIGIVAVIVARWALANEDGLLDQDQANFMVATLVMMAVPSFVFAGYCAVRLVQLMRESELPFTALLRSEED